MGSNLYQMSLILLGIAATLFLSIFLYREIAPEYLIYQDDFIALENFRTSYTHQPAPAFKRGVKQIVIEKEDNGPPIIDRCISCHVALQIEDFSPTKIARDVNGQIEYDAFGFPKKIENPNYVWSRLNEKISELKNEKNSAKLALATKYEALKTAQVGEFTYNVEKVLQMHPLMGRETRPFEYHPIDEYGCTSCHGGNGRGLVTDRAHGPVFDEQYEIEYQGYKPNFLEIDPENDPPFAKVFNDKPGHRLIFQTDPILVGTLIQAKCISCHQESQGVLQGATSSASTVLKRKEKEVAEVQKAFELEQAAVFSLIDLKKRLKSDGYEATLKNLQNEELDLTRPDKEREKLASQYKFLKEAGSKQALEKVNKALIESFGSEKLSDIFAKEKKEALESFLNETKGEKGATGSLYQKLNALNLNQEILKHVEDVDTSFQQAVGDEKAMNAIQTDVDLLTADFHQGKNLYISQACYACHRIATFSRGGVGPELSREGDVYPWYIKQKISWPQSDLRTSTMPNYHLDHEELEDLMAFILSQKGPGKKLSQTQYKTLVQEWEAGKKQSWEERVTPAQIHDERFGMTVFATEGCAACHRLLGFESNVGFSIEKTKPSSDALYGERQWFQSLFPEEVPGSLIVDTVRKNGVEIDQHIISGVRENSILEEIEKNHPGVIESLYTNFKFASRAQNHLLKEAGGDVEKKEAALKEIKDWKERVNRVLMVYIQEYGLGRLICPRPNWSGIFRTDQWLMEHFRNPSAHVPRSIMPVFPFDDTKFYALTYMLDKLALKNREHDHAIWKARGFDPEVAFEKYCSQCHGVYRLGNGPVAEWIYPLPKNLRNADFLRNLTKEQAIQSITHGVKGTPMPPWGETVDDKPFKNDEPILNQNEIKRLADWLFSGLPGESDLRTEENVPKWDYEPKDVLEELHREGGVLEGKSSKGPEALKSVLDFFPKAEGYYAALNAAPENQKAQSVDAIFDQRPNPNPGGEKNLYYIKKKFYTSENIEQGRAFFITYCSPCHGTEADGAGMRAQAMHDAKPRMLINLDWSQNRDDLRFLRSIKYGVPGTAMTPWGDQTSSLQRLQLVIYIRSLSEGQVERSDLSSALYKAFDQAEFTIEKARVHEFSEFDRNQKAYVQAKQLREALDKEAIASKDKTQKAFEAYQKEVELGSKVQSRKATDALFQKLRGLIKQEKEIYKQLGEGFVNSGIDGKVRDNFLKLIAMNDNFYSIDNETLMLNEKAIDKAQMKTIEEAIITELDNDLKMAADQRLVMEGRLPSQERSEEISLLNTKVTFLKKQKTQLISGLEEVMRLVNEQKAIFQKITEQTRSEDKKDTNEKSPT